MKTSFLLQCKITLNTIFSMRILITALMFFAGTQLYMLYAQSNARLSVQGILKKASGEAVDDGLYDLTFKLYTDSNTTSHVWMEIQPDVEIVSGIYSAVLGNVTNFAIPFNQIYYLGVAVGSGSSEMKPRVQLTSAPYALALIGVNNQFPSSGQVIADSIEVQGNVLTQNGAPGANGANKNGYGFLNDRDSGLFSLTSADGSNAQVSLFVNKDEEIKVRPDTITLNTKVIRFNNDEGRLNYNGLDDWRLVETDYFETDAEEWKRYTAWNAVGGNGATVVTFPGAFAGKALTSNADGQAFKKLFTLPGSSVTGTYTYVKVVFKYFYLDSWDLIASKKGWAGFSQTENCAALRIGWVDERAWTGYGIDGVGSGEEFNIAANFSGAGGSGAYSDQWVNEEMVAHYPSGAGNTDFWVIFGAKGELFGVGMIEIWVK